MPIREGDKWTKKYLGFLKQLTDKGLINKKTYARTVDGYKSRTLSDELYDEFWGCFKANESGTANSVGRVEGLKS